MLYSFARFPLHVNTHFQSSVLYHSVLYHSDHCTIEWILNFFNFIFTISMSGISYFGFGDTNNTLSMKVTVFILILPIYFHFRIFLSKNTFRSCSLLIAAVITTIFLPGPILVLQKPRKTANLCWDVIRRLAKKKMETMKINGNTLPTNVTAERPVFSTIFPLFVTQT